MIDVLSIDPGVRRVAFAIFSAGVLRRAVLLNIDGDAGLYALPSAPLDVVIEMPRVYPVSRQKGDPNDLLRLARVVGRLQEHYLREGKVVHLVEPRTWKGTLAKEAMTERIRGRLAPAELARMAPVAKSLEHNVLDAVGLGLHVLGRLAPGRWWRDDSPPPLEAPSGCPSGHRARQYPSGAHRDGQAPGRPRGRAHSHPPRGGRARGARRHGDRPSFRKQAEPPSRVRGRNAAERLRSLKF